MERKRIKLKNPIPGKDKDGKEITIDSLYLREMELGDFENFPDDFFDKLEKGSFPPRILIPLIASIADISIESAKKIKISDLEEVGAEIENFLSLYQGIGEKLPGE